MNSGVLNKLFCMQEGHGGQSGVPIILAPMAGITDWAYRLICGLNGCDAAFTEMISAQGYLYARRSRSAYQRLICRAPYEKPLILQLFGHEGNYLAEAARSLSELGRYVAIDINMGCPARKVTSGGSGSALMKNEILAGSLIRQTVRASSLPVSVKIRLGWDEAHINAARIAHIAQEEGAAFITVHGRTTVQQYAGHASMEQIALVKSQVSIPVIANGDIASGQDAANALQVTGADAIAIGRGALGNPWVFDQIHYYLAKEPWTPPAIKERLATARQHARFLQASAGERMALLQMRKFYAWYIKGIRGASEVRSRINTALSFPEIDRLLDGLTDI